MKWEYKIAHISTSQWSSTGLPQDVNEQFDKWGDEGWELVKVEPIHTGGLILLGFGTTTRTVALVAFFKRSKE